MDSPELQVAREALNRTLAALDATLTDTRRLVDQLPNRERNKLVLDLRMALAMRLCMMSLPDMDMATGIAISVLDLLNDIGNEGPPS